MKISKLIPIFDCKNTMHFVFLKGEKEERVASEVWSCSPKKKILKDLIKNKHIIYKQLKDKVIGTNQHGFIISFSNKIISFLYGCQVS